MKKPMLLVVEDNFDMRMLIKDEFEDFEVLESPDGFSGFEKAFSEIPDIILTDVVMPGMDGVSLCRKLKSNINTSHIPIILLTVKDSENDILEGLKAGADDYICKPFSLSILRVKVRNLIGSRKTILSHLILSTEENRTQEKEQKMTEEEKFLINAYKIVENNLNNAEFDPDDFAKEIGVSRAQLYRKINSIFGQSVKEFVKMVRLKRAAELLLTSGLNISQIAYEVGFNSVAYFTKSFSGYFYYTPTQYISLNKKKDEKMVGSK